MPAPKIEDLIAEMEEAGVSGDFIDRIKEATEASPLRKELRDAKAEAAAAIERATKAENGVLASHFAALGIKAKPDAFRIPDDLDRTDQDAVSAWAVDAGLIDPPAARVGDDHLDAEARVANAANGAAPSGPNDPTAAALNATTEADFWAAVEAGAGTQG